MNGAEKRPAASIDSSDVTDPIDSSEAMDRLSEDLENGFHMMSSTLEEHRAALNFEAYGTITFIAPGVLRLKGLAGIRYDELVEFDGAHTGIAFNIDEDEVGIIMLDDAETLSAGSRARRSHRIMDIPVGEELIGRIIDSRGRPLDDQGSLAAAERRPVEQDAPGIMARDPVTVPLQTGLKVIDALIPIGRGQRELILGDRQTGKTAIAVDTILNQKDDDVVCIYCAVGKRMSAAAKVISELNNNGAMSYSIVMSATEEDPPAQQFIAPYAAMTIGEYFMERGRDVLLVLDDLTRHARAYRELSLLLRRPPGREAYPGDIFYIHSRLLERSTHLRESLGGGSLTCLPIVETEAQNISAYIPTNLISITDGQIYLSPKLFSRGNLPAVDVGRSVSRVGGKTQLAAYRAVSGDLRLSYSQFEELEAFSRFGTRMDDETRRTLERGRRVREILKQPQYRTLTVFEQIAVLVAVNEGLLDDVPIQRIAAVEADIRKSLAEAPEALRQTVQEGRKLSREDIETLKGVIRPAARSGSETGRMPRDGSTSQPLAGVDGKDEAEPGDEEAGGVTRKTGGAGGRKTGGGGETGGEKRKTGDEDGNRESG